MMDNDNSEMINPTVPEETVNTPNNQNQYDLWGLHKTLKQKRADTRLSINNSRGELNQFLHRNVIKLNEDPLVKWENIKVIYPKLYKLTMKYLLIPGTSVPSESLFSKAGETVSKSKNRLTGKQLSKLLFLQSTNKNQ